MGETSESGVTKAPTLSRHPKTSLNDSEQNLKVRRDVSELWFHFRILDFNSQGHNDLVLDSNSFRI